MQFPITEFSKNAASPTLVGYGNATDLLTRAIDAQNKIMSSRYHEPTLIEKLEELKLKNTMERERSKYAPQFAQAELEAAQLKAPEMLSGIDRNTMLNYLGPQELSLRNNLLKYRQIADQNKLDMELAKLHGMDKRAARAQFIRALGSDQMKFLLEGNPDLAKTTSNILSQLASSSNNLEDGQSINITEDDVQRMQEGLKNINVRKVYPRSQIDQMRFAMIVDEYRKEGEKLLPFAVEYTGASGKAKLKKDQLLATSGKYTPEYSKYQQFISNAMLTANEARKELGTNATDQEQKHMRDVLNPISWLADPRTAIESYKSLSKRLETVSKNISKTPSQIQERLSGINDSDIADRANALGTTKDEFQEFAEDEGYI